MRGRSWVARYSLERDRSFRTSSPDFVTFRKSGVRTGPAKFTLSAACVLGAWQDLQSAPWNRAACGYLRLFLSSNAPPDGSS